MELEEEDKFVPELPHETPQPAAVPAAVTAREPWEDRLGGPVFVWIGGVALVLAGAFFVKYSFDRGILSPGVRLMLGALFGVALVGAAQWLHGRSFRVGAAACGAGVADLFAVVLAATSVYHFLGPVTGLVLLGGVAAAAVALSLRHGAMVALLGLLGGYITPALIGAADMTLSGIFGYLLALEVGLVVVTRSRQWSGLATLTLVGALGWAGYGLVLSDAPDTRLLLTGFLAASATAFVVAAVRTPPAETIEGLWPIRLAFSACGMAVAMVSIVVGLGGFTVLDFATFGILSAATLVLGRLDPRYDRLPWITLPIATLLIATSIVARGDGDPVLLRWTVVGLFAIFGLGAYGCVWNSRRPASWAGLSTAAAVGAILLGVLNDPDWPHWWVPTSAMALLLVAGTAGLLQRRVLAPYDTGASVMAVAAAGLASLAVYFGLDPQWMPIGWAALAVVTAVAWTRTRLPLLRFAVGGNITLMGLALAVTLPETVMADSHWLANDLWLYLGVPAALLGALAWWLHRAEKRSWAEASGALCAAAIGLLGISLVRHGFHSGDRTGLAPVSWPTVWEWSAYSVLGLALGVVGLALVRRLPLRMTRHAGVTALGVGAAALTWGPVVVTNPMWAGDVAQVHVPALLLFYALPAVLAGLAAQLLVRLELKPFAEAATHMALVLLAMLGVTGLRLAWHTPIAPAVWPDAYEWTAYALLMLGFAAILLAKGLLAEALPTKALPTKALSTKAQWTPLEAPHRAGLAAVVLAAAALTAGPLIGHNPLWSPVDVGATPVFNGLLLLYGLPILAGAGLAWLMRRRGLRPWAVALAISTVVLSFALLSLEIRQAFVGPRLDTAGVQQMEWYAYSFAWVVFALALLAIGWLRDRRSLRYGGLLVMALAIAKVFAIDTAHLQDLYRVLSLTGLGLALLGVAFGYTRLTAWTRRARAESAD